MTASAFTFATAARVLFGAGRAAELPALVAEHGGRAFVCTGAHPERHARLLDDFSVPVTMFAVAEEPTAELAADAVRAARAFHADVVVAVGGGSVLDLGKAVAALLGNGGEPLDYLEVIGRGRPLRAPSAPYLAAPTTAGTGAEVTANAVLASHEHRVKVSMRSPLLLPRVALVDPVLALGSPPGITATSGLDALTQCLEPYVSPYANVLTDGFAREGLRRAAASLRPAFEDGRSLAARADMARCALLGGLALANAKLGAVHGLAGVIGGMIDAPHGAVCAALLAPVTETNVRALREREPGAVALARYDEVARLLTGRYEAVVEDGIVWIRETVAALDVPGLGAYGLRQVDLDDVISKAQRASSMRGNPVDLTAEELHAAVVAAL